MWKFVINKNSKPLALSLKCQKQSEQPLLLGKDTLLSCLSSAHLATSNSDTVILKAR